MIYIPQRLNVGFQTRNDTYTGKLAYVIYYDERNTLRKEASWNSWRDKNIPSEEYQNSPVSGFVLNKKVGGYSTSCGYRQSYIRVYDPRGFEFEITVGNLLFILENTNSIKGKGLEGEFIYGWDGTELVLLPVYTNEYNEALEYSTKLRAGGHFLKPSEFVIGHQYANKKGVVYTYMGKFDRYDYSGEKYSKQQFFFAREAHVGSSYSYLDLQTYASLSNKFITYGCEMDENYAKLYEDMECTCEFSPIDHNADKFVPMTYQEFVRQYTACRFSRTIIVSIPDICRMYISECGGIYKCYLYDRLNYRVTTADFETNMLPDIFARYRPMKRQVFLQNGKLYREEFYY